MQLFLKVAKVPFGVLNFSKFDPSDLKMESPAQIFILRSISVLLKVTIDDFDRKFKQCKPKLENLIRWKLKNPSPGIRFEFVLQFLENKEFLFESFWRYSRYHKPIRLSNTTSKKHQFLSVSASIIIESAETSHPKNKYGPPLDLKLRRGSDVRHYISTLNSPKIQQIITDVEHFPLIKNLEYRWEDLDMLSDLLLILVLDGGLPTSTTDFFV